MKIKEIKHIEDCLDGSLIKEIYFHESIDYNFICFLGLNGKLKYYSSFARPFFKIINNPYYELKGIEGSNSIRIIIKKDINDFIDIVSQYKK